MNTLPFEEQSQSNDTAPQPKVSSLATASMGSTQVSPSGPGAQKQSNPLPFPGSNQQKPNPAMQSLKKFGGMINENIAQPVANALNHANPVTLTKNVWDAAGKLPQAAKDYDAVYGDRVRSDLAQTAKANGPLPLPTSLNKTLSSVSKQTVDPFAEGVEAQLPTRPGANPESVNNPLPLPPEMRSDPMPSVNIQKIDYASGGQFSPADKQIHAQEQNLANNRLPEFDNSSIQNKYADLNDRTANQARFERNRTDALAQDKASGEMVARLNRGTDAMAEVRQMRSGVPDGSGPSTGNIRQRLPMPNSKNSETKGSAKWFHRQAELRQNNVDRALNIQEQQNNAENDLSNQKLQTEQQLANSAAQTAQEMRTGQAKQQSFMNQMAENNYQLDKEKANKKVAPNYKPHFAKTFNPQTGAESETYAGYFNPQTGSYTKAPTAEPQVPKGFEIYKTLDDGRVIYSNAAGHKIEKAPQR